MPKTYVALVSEDQTQVEFNEFYDDESQAKDRAKVLECEAAGRGSGWKAYIGQLPVEAFMASVEFQKANSLAKEPEDGFTAWKAKLDKVTADAIAETKAIPGEPPFDDRVTLLTCAKCSAKYSTALDWCPKCLTRPGHSQAILDANKLAQDEQAQKQKDAEAQAVREGLPLMKAQLIQQSIDAQTDMEAVKR